MSSKVDEAIAEIDAALADMAPKHEGLRDFARLNIQEETKEAVTAAIVQYDRRRDLLNAAREHLTTLVSDGYPVLDIEAVSLTVLADLQAQNATIDAALTQFHSTPASQLGLGGGAPEPK